MLTKWIGVILVWLVSLIPQAAKPPVPANPYFISSLQQRTYSSEIKTESLAYSSAQYDSYVVSFMSDGLKEYALWNVPKGQMPEGGWPVVVLNHGHINPPAYSTTASYVVPAADFARAGFMVLKPDYRGNANSQGAADDLTSRIDYSVDVLNLLAGIKNLPKANANRIYIWGHSLGGDVSLRVLEICGKCVKAASLWAPAVTSWPETMLYFVRRNHDSEWLNRVETELNANFTPDDYAKVSDLDNVSLVEVPINLQQGTADESVPYAWGQELAKKFTDAGVKFTFFSYPGDNHNLTHNWNTAIARDVKLFNEVK